MITKHYTNGDFIAERKELYTKGRKNQTVELKISLKMVEAESNSHGPWESVLDSKQCRDGIPFLESNYEFVRSSERIAQSTMGSHARYGSRFSNSVHQIFY